MKFFFINLIATISLSSLAFEAGDYVGSKDYISLGFIRVKYADQTFLVDFDSGSVGICNQSDLGRVDICTSDKRLCAGDIVYSKKGDPSDQIIRAIFSDNSVLLEKISPQRLFSIQKDLSRFKRQYLTR